MTIQVLHLVDGSAGEEPLLAARAAAEIPHLDVQARGPAVGHEVWLLGGSEAAERASVLGVQPRARLSAPGGVVEVAARAGRRLAADRRGLYGRAWPDLVHCTSVSTLSLARLLFGRSVPRVATITTGPPVVRGFLDRRRHVHALSPGIDGPVLLTPARSLWQAWRQAGIGDVRTCLPPAAAGGTQPRAWFREAAGLGPDDVAVGMVALIADPPRLADARLLAFVLGLMHTTGRKAVGIVPRGSHSVRRAARFIRLHGRRWGLVESSLPMSHVIPGCDAAIWPRPHRAGDGRGPGGGGGWLLARSFAMAGVPVIVGGADAAAELGAGLPPQRAGVVLAARDGQQRSLAAALLPVLDELVAGRIWPAGEPPAADIVAGRLTREPKEYVEVLAGIWRELIRPAMSARAAEPGAAPSPVFVRAAGVIL